MQDSIGCLRWQPEEVEVDFDFTFRELLKIAIFVVIAVIVGFIIYVAVAIAPEAIKEFVDNMAASGISMTT